MYLSNKWTRRLFLEEGILFEAWKVAGSAMYKQSKTVWLQIILRFRLNCAMNHTYDVCQFKTPFSNMQKLQSVIELMKYKSVKLCHFKDHTPNNSQALTKTCNLNTVELAPYISSSQHWQTTLSHNCRYQQDHIYHDQAGSKNLFVCLNSLPY